MPQEIEPTANGGLPPRVAQGFDRVLSVQRPVVLAHLRQLRSARPDATPAELIRTLERRYLAAVTGGGALVGASSAIPAVGVGTSLVLSGVETAGFLETTALFAQSVTEIHGIAVVEPERARTLVMAMMLGTGGQELLQQIATQATGGGSRTAYWGEFVTKSLPRAAFGPVADRIRSSFLRRFAVTQGTSVVGRMIPFGVGAIVGGTGNHLLGRKIVQSARAAFGPPPATFPAVLDPVVRAPRTPGAPRAPRAPKPPRLRAPAPRLGPRLPPPRPLPGAGLAAASDAETDAIGGPDSAS